MLNEGSGETDSFKAEKNCILTAVGILLQSTVHIWGGLNDKTTFSP